MNWAQRSADLCTSAAAMITRATVGVVIVATRGLRGEAAFPRVLATPKGPRLPGAGSVAAETTATVAAVDEFSMIANNVDFAVAL